MAGMTSEKIIGLARQLPPGEQIKIVARLSEGLIQAVSEHAAAEATQPLSPTDLIARLRESAVIPSNSTDAVKTLHEVREERSGGQ